MREILEELVAIMGAECPLTEYAYPEKTFDKSYGGGDCSKHGRYYGMCHCCDAERKSAFESTRKRFEWDQESKLRNLAIRAKFILNP
jgi:hypothetical protein